MFWREGRGVCARKLSNSQAQKAVGAKASFEVGKAVRPTLKQPGVVGTHVGGLMGTAESWEPEMLAKQSEQRTTGTVVVG